MSSTDFSIFNFGSFYKFSSLLLLDIDSCICAFENSMNKMFKVETLQQSRYVGNLRETYGLYNFRSSFPCGTPTIASSVKHYKY